jgi:hypothetical protein
MREDAPTDYQPAGEEVWIRNASLERKIYLLTAVVGALVTLADFLGLLDLSGSTLGRMTLVLVSLLIVASASQTHEILRAVNAARSHANAFEFVEMHSGVPRRFEESVRSANQINEAVLTWYVEQPQTDRDRYRALRDKRVLDGDAVLNQLVIVRHEQHFREVLGTALRFENSPRYTLRYFPISEGPPLPLINLWSFDAEMYLGSIDVREPTLNSQMLHISDAALVTWMSQYWSAAWAESREQWLKRGSSVNMTAFRSIAIKIGIDEEAFNNLVQELRPIVSGGDWVNGELVKHARRGSHG